MSWRAVLALITRWPVRLAAPGRTARRGPVVPATMVGGTRTPPLAMVAYTPAICTAVTATPWPKARV